MSRPLLLVGLDAADWQVILPMVHRGELPSLAKLLKKGVAGDLRTLHPSLSPLLWTSIVTGKRAASHGITGFTAVDNQTGRVRPVSSVDRTCRAIWNILHHEGKTCHIANWFASHPAEPIRGSIVSDRFPTITLSGKREISETNYSAYPASCYDAIRELRLEPQDIDPSVLDLFFPNEVEATETVDRARKFLAKIWARTFSVHNAFTWQIDQGEWDFAAVYYNAIDAVCHTFMNWHPPKLEWVSQEGYSQLNKVVGATYRMFDLMLARLIEIAGEGTNIVVISDHGFKSGEERQHPELEKELENFHRDFGIGLFSGPDFQAGCKFSGASLMDIAPSLLVALGIAPARDMTGRVLTEIFRSPTAIQYIDSWENVAGDFGNFTEPYMDEPDDALLEHFSEIGYFDLSGDNSVDAERARRDRLWNLARDYIDSGQPAEALPLMVDVYEREPFNRNISTKLAQCLAAVGKTEEACEVIEALIPNLQKTAEEEFLRGMMALWRGQAEDALAIFRRVESQGKAWPALLLMMAEASSSLSMFALSEKMIRRAIQQDTTNAIAWRDLTGILLQLRRWDEAMEAGLKAVEFRHDMQVAHYYLGQALFQMGQYAPAEQAYQLAIQLMPGFIKAREAYANLLDRMERNADAEAQRELIKKCHQAREENSLRLAPLREQVNQVAVRLRHFLIEVKKKQDSPKEAPLVIVSGLPRSGTSAMMSVLQSAGIPLCADEKKAPDEANPMGYFEWEAINRLAQDPQIIAQAKGKALKVPSPQIRGLPMDRRYKIIFMIRELTECAMSHEKMHSRMSPEKVTLDQQMLVASLEQHRDQVLHALEATGNIDLLKIDYSDLISDTLNQIRRILHFIERPEESQLIEAMMSAIDPTLYRNRTRLD